MIRYKAFATEFYLMGNFCNTVLPFQMKIWNDENANRKSSKMPCKIPWESVSFLLSGDDILDVGFF